MALFLLPNGMRKVSSKGAVFKLAISDVLFEAVKANHMRPVPLIYSELSASLFALRNEESPHASKPLHPWPSRSRLSPSFAGWLPRIDEDGGLQLVRQENQFGIGTVIQFVSKIGWCECV